MTIKIESCLPPVTLHAAAMCRGRDRRHSSGRPLVVAVAEVVTAAAAAFVAAEVVAAAVGAAATAAFAAAEVGDAFAAAFAAAAASTACAVAVFVEVVAA